MSIKIKVETQFDYIGGESMQQGEEEVELSAWENYQHEKRILMTINGTQYDFPASIFEVLLKV